MKHRQNFNLKLTLQFVNMALLSIVTSQAMAAPLALSSVPLFLTNKGKPNILMMMGNANSMDEDATGGAVGSAAMTSKSEIARNAMKSIITSNMGLVNMGLLAYAQNPSTSYYLSAGQYDVSYNAADYNAAFTGARNSQTKKFKTPNPTSPGDFIYYNIALPSYDSSSPSNLYCDSITACTDPTHDFFGTSNSSCATLENASTGPWDIYFCFANKSGTSNLAPVGVTTTGYEFTGNGGYDSYIGSYVYNPTTSDLGQGITDFGKRMTSIYVDRAWFNNTSPGKGYLHTPLALLNNEQATKLNKKLTTSKPATDSNSPKDPDNPLQNSGLAPLEGTLITAKKYFNNQELTDEEGGEQDHIPDSCGKNFLVLLSDGLPSVTQNGNPSANVTQNLTDVTTQATSLLNSTAKVKTYMIGFALPYGVNPAQLNTIAAAGGTGAAYSANDATTLNTAFSNIFSDIYAQTASASAVALNSGSLNTNSHVYQAKFDSHDWSGKLLSIAVNASNGSLGSTIWDAGQQINAQAATNRKILTYKPSTKAGIAFRWPATSTAPTSTELDSSQIDALNTSATNIVDTNGSDRLNYLRGSITNEGKGLGFRARNTSKLGDIVDSAPQYVGAPSLNISDSSYAAFRLENKSRSPIIYVGANDGMLHGFEAATGNEAIAYIPSSVYSNLTKLTSTTYNHRYYVDGSPSTADVYFDGSWHTALVGSMGNGAKGIFGLDITDPSSFSEANAAALVNFEFPNNATATADANDVGYVAGPVPMVKLNNGEWAAIFGNGYNSTGTGQSSLFIVNVKTGALIQKISTGAGSSGSPNALANPIAVDVDGNNTADVVYAGDLQGNMWKFDITSTSSAAWSVSKLYAAGQPITETPAVAKNPAGGFMVYFGTGKYLESTDIATNEHNAFYGIWDHGNTTVTQGDLTAQQITSTDSITGQTYRKVSQNSVNYTGSTPKKGWYINLPTTGERSVNDPKIRAGRVIFTTTIPSSGTCSYGGTSTTMVLDYLTGGMPSTAAIDTNNDGAVNTSDTIVAGIVNNSISSSPTIFSGTNSSGIDYGLTTKTDGKTTEIKLKKSDIVSRRTSWRQIPLQ